MQKPSPPTTINVSSQQIAAFRENGWVRMENVMSTATAAEILRLAKERMGHHPESASRSSTSERIRNEYAWYARWDGCSHENAWIHSMSHSVSLARVAAKLMGSSQVRFYFDHIFAKTPASGGGTETPWHQDLPHHPIDRQGALTMWIPLVDCSPEMGTMRFLNGSQRAGPLGRFLNRDDGVSLVDENAWVLDSFHMSEPLFLRAGDATVHNLGVVHHAPANTTEKTRWVYVTQWLPVNARYTGAPNHRTDGLGLTIDRPLDHPRFPVIST